MKIDKKFINRQNLYYEVGFLVALQQWREEPDISFLRIFKDSFKKQGLWPTDENFTREQVLIYVLRYMQISMAMQIICYSNEIIKEAGLNQGAQDVKNKLKEIKTKLDVDGKEKTTNALQMMKIIREAFAHNDDDATISNWEMDNNCNVTIQSAIGKTGERHNIKFSFKDLTDFSTACLTNLQSLTNHGIELDVNGVKLAKLFSRSDIKVHPKQIKNVIKLKDLKTNESVEMDEYQVNAIINCYKNKFFHDEGVKESLASPFRPDFVGRLFPYTFNPHNMVLDLRLAANSLYYLPQNYKTNVGWFKPILQSHIEEEHCTREIVTHLHYTFMTGHFDSIIISNILFSIFSFESSDRLDRLFGGEGLDVNRIRNSIMHGRFYYNFDNAYDFYDGRNNNDLEYIGNLSIYKIVEVAQILMHEYLDEYNIPTNTSI